MEQMRVSDIESWVSLEDLHKNFLSFEKIQAILDRFTYKPNWRFTLYRMTSGAPWLYVSMLTKDTYGKIEGDIDIGFREPLRNRAYYRDEMAFLHWLKSVIDRIEQHETREWMKIDGRMLFDPHQNGAQSF